MYIYNTTFAVSTAKQDSWVEFMKLNIIPIIIEEFKNVRCAKIIAEVQEGYTSYALQFEVETLQNIDTWKVEQENTIQANLRQKYGDNILFFSTTMESIL